MGENKLLLLPVRCIADNSWKFVELAVETKSGAIMSRFICFTALSIYWKIKGKNCSCFYIVLSLVIHYFPI